MISVIDLRDLLSQLPFAPLHFEHIGRILDGQSWPLLQRAIT